MWTEEKEATSNVCQWQIYFGLSWMPIHSNLLFHIQHTLYHFRILSHSFTLAPKTQQLEPLQSYCFIWHAHPCPKMVTFRDTGGFLWAHMLFVWYLLHTKSFDFIQRFKTGIFPLSTKRLAYSFTSFCILCLNCCKEVSYLTIMRLFSRPG